MSNSVHKRLLSVSRDQFNTLGDIITTNGVLHLEKKDNDLLFEYLVRTVAGQQLSKIAASTIWGRVISLCESYRVSVYDLCGQENVEALKSCGLSRYKVKAIVGVKDAFIAGAIDSEYLSSASYETIYQSITSLWGFGSWSADMIALFFFGHADVWSVDDVALQRGIRFIENNDHTTEGNILEAVSPYKSYLSLHLWKAIDTNLIK